MPFNTFSPWVGCGRKSTGLLFSVKPLEGAVLPEQIELKLSAIMLEADGERKS